MRSGSPADVNPHALALRWRGAERPLSLQPGPWRCFTDRAPPLVVHVHGSSAFRATWSGVLRLAGAEVHAAWPCGGCHYVLAEAPVVKASAAEVARWHGCGAHVVCQ